MHHNMDSKTYSSILKTVCYADIFDFPLTEKEVSRWVNDIKILRYSDIKRANGIIAHKDRFMFLKSKEHLIEKREEREAISHKKLLVAKRIASILKYIPTVKLIGVSGSVAMKNADDDDDIDLFIITSANTIWLTRLFTTVFVELFSRRRRRRDTYVSDKICLNMFVDEQFLTVPKEKQNLYTAHEVCQLEVLYDCGNTYYKFFVANSWVKKYLPNGIDIRILRYYDIKRKKERAPNILISQSLNIFNAFAKHLQLWYMRRHRTSETITDHYLAFHPKDYTNDILAALEKRMLLYGSKV